MKEAERVDRLNGGEVDFQGFIRSGKHDAREGMKTLQAQTKSLQTHTNFNQIITKEQDSHPEMQDSIQTHKNEIDLF